MEHGTKRCASARWPGGTGQPLWRGPDESLLSEVEKHAGSEQELPARSQAVLVPNTCFSAHTSPHINITMGARRSEGAGMGPAVDTCFKIHTGPSETPSPEFNPILKD